MLKFPNSSTQQPKISTIPMSTAMRVEQWWLFSRDGILS